MYEINAFDVQWNKTGVIQSDESHVAVGENHGGHGDESSELGVADANANSPRIFKKYHSFMLSVAMSKVGVAHCGAFSKKSTDSITGIPYYLNNC